MIRLPRITLTMQVVVSTDLTKPCYARIRLPVSSWSLIDDAFRELRHMDNNTDFMLRMNVNRDGVSNSFVFDWPKNAKVIDHTTHILSMLSKCYSAYDISAIMAQVENLPMCNARAWVDSILGTVSPAVNPKGVFSG